MVTHLRIRSLRDLANHIYYSAHDIYESEPNLLKGECIEFSLEGIPANLCIERIIRYYHGSQTYASARMENIRITNERGSFNVSFSPFRPMKEFFPNDIMPEATATPYNGNR